MLSKVKYLGDLRTESVHIRSGQSIISDAPIDNQGRGEAFSPTDIVTNAVASCMFTIMGIKAKAMDLDISNSTAAVFKEMRENPRMISKVGIAFEMIGVAAEKDRVILERAAMTCPVFLSLHSDIEKDIQFNWK
ncbi:OsmC family protein [Flavobacterium sp. HSC-61S13]|uniref:OsmC family protein n=1 Tax=Flavobacterium sp. HSC-61S13 TaxID=2910963 RepID=UPI00209CED09|nr:OsmC family protein [Flavobacterium sp. HSC-61S13]MCP1994732.1 putative OsmC-like protein [Flavobacterium sp. HSC-61S13]